MATNKRGTVLVTLEQAELDEIKRLGRITGSSAAHILREIYRSFAKSADSDDKDDAFEHSKIAYLKNALEHIRHEQSNTHAQTKNL